MVERRPAQNVRFRLLRWSGAGFLFLLFITAEIAAAATTRLPPIPVNIVESDGIERRSWPVTFGVPFPRSMLRGVAGIALVDEKGKAQPLQTRVLSQWDDGSVRWALLDTQVSVEARQSRPWRIVLGKPGKSPAKLKVEPYEGGFRIDTGALRFVIPKQHFGIAEKIEAGDMVLPGPLTSVLSKGGVPGAARTPRQILVREQGPLRARFELQGNYGNNFTYVIRVDAYAGQPFVRVLHTFIDHDPTASVSVERIAVEIPVKMGDSASYAVGVSGVAPRTGSLTAKELHWVQLDNVAYEADTGTAQGRLEGWISVRAKSAALGLSSRWFWQEYPQSFVLKPDRLTYNLWAPEAGSATVGMGAAKTHEFVFWMGSPEPSARDLAVGSIKPLVAVVDPAWVARSRALPLALAPGSLTDTFIRKMSDGFDRYQRRNDAERWDDSGRAKCSSWFPGRPRAGAYGMWNWGDWNFPEYHDQTKGCDAWGNLEYDTAEVLALTFAATGRPEVHEAMAVAARHFMDVDTVHFHAKRPGWVGMNHPKNPLHFSFEIGGLDLGHTWTEGLVSYYYLTGDERGLEAARGIADFLARRLESPIRAPNPRQVGWPQVALVAVYWATGERRYLDAAREYARLGMRFYQPDNVSHWKNGLLADAIAYTHAATQDPELEQWLRRYAETVGRRKPVRDARFVPAVAYVAGLTRDQELRALALESAERLKLGNWGKPFSISGRLGFRIYSLLAEPPAAKRPPAARRRAAPAKKGPKRQ